MIIIKVNASKYINILPAFPWYAIIKFSFGGNSKNGLAKYLSNKKKLKSVHKLWRNRGTHIKIQLWNMEPTFLFGKEVG